MTFESGIYDLPEADYLADPVPGGSLSSSGARALLPPSCPARYKYERDHPVYKDVFDFGSAAHKLALGIGPEIIIVDADNWRKKVDQDKQKEAREAGQIPLLKADYVQVAAMAEALHAHPLASKALDPARGGKPEQSLFAQDERTGVWRRARLDWMPDPHSAVRPVIFDYKTARSADPASFARHAWDYGYFVQAAFYADLFCDLTGVDAPFLFIVQEKEPPHLVSVCQPDAWAMEAGRQKCRQALEIFRDCTEAGVWPDYGSDVIHSISLPPWARSREDYL